MQNQANIHVGSRKRVSPQQIIMIQAEINYSIIYFSNGNKILVATCLKKLEKRFSTVDSFARVHKSFLVNLDYLKSYNEGRFQLENDLSCIVSRRKFKKLIDEKRVII